MSEEDAKRLAQIRAHLEVYPPGPGMDRENDAAFLLFLLERATAEREKGAAIDQANHERFLGVAKERDAALEQVWGLRDTLRAIATAPLRPDFERWARDLARSALVSVATTAKGGK